MALPRGTRIRRYEIESLIAEGGMGAVYRARDVELDRVVALKVLRHADERRFIQEGRAAIALNHPHIAHLYDFGEEIGLRFMAMEFVEGETLRARLWRGPLTAQQAIDIASQAASALGHAHRAGILHRDIKPDNLMLRPDGYVKVLDFGLARVEGNADMLTQPGFTVGTVDYMSPEQLRGENVDARTDIYALGVVLREMAGDAKELRPVIAKATAKSRDERYATAEEFIEAMKAARSPRRRRIWPWAAAAAIAAVVLGQFAMSRRPEAVVPAPQPARTESLTVTTTPPGANVFLERVKPDGSVEPRTLAGTTPLQKFAVARGSYVLTIEREGFAPFARNIAFLVIRQSGVEIPPRPVSIDRTLVPHGEVPQEMVAVDGGNYRIAAWSRPTHRIAQLDPFLIDRLEVTNREFAEFVKSGGYERRELWKHPFVKDGRTLPFDEAMKLLRDTTGLPAPRSWSQQEFPPGRDAYPVTGVTWYEAAAYAEFRSKSLPTLHQWDQAARDGSTSPFGLIYPWGLAPPGVDVLQRANFRGQGPLPAGSMRSGMSPYGAQHMAGNVAEWCLNAIDDGFAAAGGGYDSPLYGFGSVASFPPFYSGANLGFRCARVRGTPSGDQGAAPISRTSEARKFRPAGDEEFRRLAAIYDYEKTPLDARVIEREVTDAWTLETVEFNGSGGERARAHLVLPKHRQPPFELLFFVPPGDVAGGLRPLAPSMLTHTAAHVRHGRAVFGVVLRGYLGRPSNQSIAGFHNDQAEFADAAALSVIDLRRGLDYLETRPEIDASRMALFAPSAGGTLGILFAGVDHRFRSVFFTGFGVSAADERTVAEASKIHFAPRIEGPKLLMHGRWDETMTLDGEARPLYAILSEPKRLLVYDGGHVPAPDLLQRTIRSWLDETLTKSRGPERSRTTAAPR